MVPPVPTGRMRALLVRCGLRASRQGMAPPLRACREAVADFKKNTRVIASPKEWRELRKILADGCCVTDCRTPATDLHHVVPRSLRGGDVAENLVPLCHPHHMVYEDRAFGWLDVAGAIRRVLTAEQVAYVTDVKSEAWLTRYYGELRVRDK